MAWSLVFLKKYGKVFSIPSEVTRLASSALRRISTATSSEPFLIHCTRAHRNYVYHNEMATMTATQSKRVKAFPVPGPIELLHTNGARTFTHIHPILLLTAYYLQFSALVANPVSGLLASLLPLAIIQTCYIVTCLPSASGSATAFGKGARGGHRKKPVHAKSVAGPADKAVVSTFLILDLSGALPSLTTSALGSYSIPNPIARPRSTRPHRDHDPLRRPTHHPYLPHPPRRHSRLSPSHISALLRVWSRRREMEADSRRCAAVGRGFRRDFGDVHRVLAGRRTDPIGLVTSPLEELSSYSCSYCGILADYVSTGIVIGRHGP